MNKKWTYAYFEHPGAVCTPLDLGYAKANILKDHQNASIQTARLNAREDGSILEKEAFYLAGFESDYLVIFLDNILWSMQYYGEGALTFCHKLKTLQPKIKIGFHSYKIRDEQINEILSQHSEISFILRGEPETSLKDLYEEKPYSSISGVHSINHGKINHNQDPPLLEDLDQLPSPILSGVLDDFIHHHPFENFLMSTTRGCPFRCHYCFRSVKFSHVRTFSIKRVLDEIQYLTQRGIISIFMLDDCFIVDHKRFKDMVTEYEKRFPHPESMPRIMIMSRPEFLNEEIIDLFPKMNIQYVQLGLQSIHPNTATIMGRGVSTQEFVDLIKYLQSKNIFVHLDVILGLPNDDLDHCIKTLDLAFDLKPGSIQIKQLYQNPNTLFDVEPEKYGIKVKEEKHFLHVPFVESTNTFSNEDIQIASEHAFLLRNNHPEIKIKIVSQFHRINDFRKK